jgi:hypothetical protein
MATTALPIRELSANVQYEAASAQKAFWGVVESKQQQAYFHWMIWFMTRKLGHRMGRLVVSQEKLIEHLRKVPVENVSAADYSKVGGDLDRLVSMTEALLADSYQLPDRCTAVWSDRLDKIAGLNGYIESFAESFRVAGDETCTALLAEVTRRIAVEETVPA